MNKKWLAALCLLFSVTGGLLADELNVYVYPLSEKVHKIMRLDSVYDGFLQFPSWYDSVKEMNPQAAASISYERVATIDVKSDRLDGVGSEDPFVLSARKKAAEIGANLLSYTSGVVTKTTDQTVSMTFTAMRVKYDSYILPPSDFSLLSSTPVESGLFRNSVVVWNEMYFPERTKIVQSPDYETRNPMLRSYYGELKAKSEFARRFLDEKEKLESGQMAAAANVDLSTSTLNDLEGWPYWDASHHRKLSKEEARTRVERYVEGEMAAFALNNRDLYVQDAPALSGINRKYAIQDPSLLMISWPAVEDYDAWFHIDAGLTASPWGFTASLGRDYMSGGHSNKKL